LLFHANVYSGVFLIPQDMLESIFYFVMLRYIYLMCKIWSVTLFSSEPCALGREDGRRLVKYWTSVWSRTEQGRQEGRKIK
jgi:hypothetical protein